MPDPLSTWGGVASVAGIFLTIGGFIWTLIGVYRSKNAAQQAKEAAEKARDDIFHASAMVELTAAMSAMQEIKRLQRDEAWSLLLDRYSTLRASLISIRAARPNLTEEHKTTIQGAIAQIRMIEDKVERALAADQKPSVAKLNAIIADQLDNLSEVLGALRITENG